MQRAAKQNGNVVRFTKVGSLLVMVPATARANWCSWEFWSIGTSSFTDSKKFSRDWQAIVRKGCSLRCTTCAHIVKYPNRVPIKWPNGRWTIRTHTHRSTARWLTSASHCVTVFSLTELLHSRTQDAEPNAEQNSVCCCSSVLLCHSCLRNSSFSYTHTHTRWFFYTQKTHIVTQHIQSNITCSLTSVSFWNLACASASWDWRRRHSSRSFFCSWATCFFTTHTHTHLLLRKYTWINTTQE